MSSTTLRFEMFPREYKTNSKRKRITEEIPTNRNVKQKTVFNSTIGNVSTSGVDPEKNRTKIATYKEAPTKALAPGRKIPLNNVVVSNNNTHTQSNEKKNNYKDTTTTINPGPSRPIINSNDANIMAEIIKLRAETAQCKEQLTNLRRETAECKEHNKVIETEFPRLRDELAQVKRDHETMLDNIGQAKMQANIYAEDLKVLNEQLDAINRENNKFHEDVLKLKKDLNHKNDKIVEQKSLQESLLKQIQENYDSLRVEENTRKELHNQLLDLKGNIRVMCRVRPCTNKEREDQIELAKLECSDNKRTIKVSTKRLRLWQVQVETSTYEFDHIFGENANQNEIYSELSPLVQSAIDGYNVCIFAYGQTGSGKTYTMEGDVSSPEKKGMIPRAIDEIFDKIKNLEKLGWNFGVYVQYIEIYNESIQDLLVDEDKTYKDRKKSYKDRKKSCKESKDLCKIVYNENTHMTIIENAERHKITRKKDMENLLRKASECRSKSSTNSNSVSSRSHGVFILHLEGENTLGNMSSQGSLSLIDLAGSENIDKSGSIGNQMTEAQNINKSLFYLRNVIQQIKDKSNYVNYRDSVLTSLLKYSLGGTAKVCMLVNVSPLADSVNETKKSLTFGQTARKTHVGTASRSGRF
ncbi:P-loop containing nucleoside triphosphate hydrolase protein [Glomus cerebriforme]|uniref:Kinesin-like protein n=1 Tax=Glomus cerebriforme TaxID=658196 RepID=A0A397SAG0_9GLOM|nr:P-loop containing nucleoside triphosphate hydrolase protein [Glomus cerebriforme]